MKKKIAIFIGILLLLSTLAAVFVSGIVIGGVLTAKKKPAALKETGGGFVTGFPKTGLIGEIFYELSHSYVDRVRADKLEEGAINGMLESLDDPYTRRLKENDYSSFQEQTTGRFGGVGIEIGMRDKQITVVAPIKDTPADHAGVQSGDTIVKIDNKSTEGMALEKAVELIRGPEKTVVTLGLIREGGKSLSVKITRGQIKIPNVKSDVLGRGGAGGKGKTNNPGPKLDSDLGYIVIHAFNADTSKDVKTELERLKSKGAKGIIVDLRGNPGGLLNEAVALSSLFIESGPIVKIKSRSGRIESLTANPGADSKIPLVVLVNKGSASASEIFAGAVQDTKRGIVVGETTFGKGSVQTVIPLSDGSGLILTTAKYLTPKNRSLNKKGIKPDIVVKIRKKNYHKIGGPNDKQIKKAEEVLLDLIDGKKVKKAS